MNKKIRVLIPLTLAYMLIWSSISLSASLNIYHENQKIYLYPQPFIQHGRTLVPVRAMFEMNGYGVEWDQKSQTITINKDTLDIRMKIGSKLVEFIDLDFDTQQYIRTVEKLEVPATIINGSTFVPLRVVSESLGIQVKWDKESNSILLNCDYPYNMDDKKQYVNERFGFSVNYPEEWDISAEGDNGDGCSIYKSNDIGVSVYGGHLLEETFEQHLNVFYSDWIIQKPMNVWGANKSYELTHYDLTSNISETIVISEKDNVLFTHYIRDNNIMDSSLEKMIKLSEARDTQASFKILEYGSDRSIYIR